MPEKSEISSNYHQSWQTLRLIEDIPCPLKISLSEFLQLYHYMRNFCNLIGLEQWYFSLI